MIVYRLQTENGGLGPFQVAPRDQSILWEYGPTPRREAEMAGDDDYYSFSMQGRVCGVHRPHLLPKWFPGPARLAEFGLVLTVWDVPDGACRTWKFQAVFYPDEATLIRTIPLPERWDDILDLLTQEN